MADAGAIGVMHSGPGIDQLAVWAAGTHVVLVDDFSIGRYADLYPTYAYSSAVEYHQLARNGRIAGTLQSAGVPMVDTWVFLTYRLTAQVIAGTRTDALGRFEFTGLYPDAKYLVSAYESRANPPGYNVVNADYITPVLT